MVALKQAYVEYRNVACRNDLGGHWCDTETSVTITRAWTICYYRRNKRFNRFNEIWTSDFIFDCVYFTFLFFFCHFYANSQLFYQIITTYFNTALSICARYLKQYRFIRCICSLNLQIKLRYNIYIYIFLHIN